VERAEGDRVHYRNPVYDAYFADPFVLRLDDGSYLAYGTGSVVGGRAFEVLSSPDLDDWTSVGGALEPAPDELGSDYWAPEVAHIDGRWCLYYSVGHGDVGHHLRVAIADDPRGPFHDQGINLTPAERFAIDPHPYRDEDGTWYLFHARDVLEGERVGTMLAVDVLADVTRLAGSAQTILTPSGDWQLFQRGRAMYDSVYDWHTLEGPFVRCHDGLYYCFYSGGNWQEATYGVAYAVASSPLGPWREPSPAVLPLLATIPDEVVGPGHCSVVAAPDGNDAIVYHAWDVNQTRRQMCIDPLVWTDDGPTTPGPTTWTA
jgi:arabinan endo-1,5-alpha-L-arabinosidase